MLIFSTYSGLNLRAVKPWLKLFQFMNGIRPALSTSSAMVTILVCLLELKLSPQLIRFLKWSSSIRDFLIKFTRFVANFSKTNACRIISCCFPSQSHLHQHHVPSGVSTNPFSQSLPETLTYKTRNILVTFTVFHDCTVSESLRCPHR